ncbi:MAG: amidase family protein, partial [Burkholderiaceae bacterium]
ISHSQDTAGPMCRSVADAALLYAALCGPDAADPGTTAAPLDGTLDGPLRLDPGRLRGARLGIARNFFTGFDEADALIEQAIARLRALGAEIIDPIELAPVGYGDAETAVLLHEFKHGLGEWLGRFAPAAPVQSLAELIAFNKAQRSREMPWFGQELFEQAQALGGLDSPAYLAALAQCRRGARQDGLDHAFATHRLDAIIAPTGSPAWLIDPVAGDHYGASFSTPAAVAGYPHLTVPAGLVRGLPIGLSFVGPAWSEALLLSLGLGFEQAGALRRPPRFVKRSVPI